MSVVKNAAVSACILLATFFICLLLVRIDSTGYGFAYVSMLFILAVLLISRITTGYSYGIVSSFLSVLAVNYFFTYPILAFNFTLPGYPITILCMLTVSVLTSALTTRIKRQEQLRSEAEYEKERANLLRAISHDIRTPLTSILGANSALMDAGAQMDETQRMHLNEEIASDAAWLLRMVENLLTITRIRQSDAHKIHKTAECVEEVLAEAVERFRRRFPACAVSVSVPETPLMCPMDATLIEQVLLNLLENTVFHAEGATKTTLLAKQEGAYTLFAVSDDGCGVPRERLRHLLDDSVGVRVSQGDTARGMGIGLTVCHAIVRAHGGEMRAQNRKGGGLTVSFTLPMEEQTP